MSNEELLVLISNWIKENQFEDRTGYLSIEIDQLNNYLYNLKEKIKWEQ